MENTTNFIDDINKQYKLYIRGLITNAEMLNNIIAIAENERSYVIECKTGKNKPWKLFTDIYYNLTEAKNEIERMKNNEAGIVFRYRAIV